MKHLMKCFFFLFLLKMACAQKPITLRIDPDNAMGGTFSQIFDSVRYLPLKTDEKDPVGDIQNMQLGPNYILFYDADAKKIRTFDKSGNQIGSIDGKNYKKIWMFNLYHFNYNPYNNKVYCKEGNNIYSFDIYGHLLNKIVLADSMQYYNSSFYFLDSTTSVFSRSNKDARIGMSYLLALRDFNTPVYHLFPMDTSDIYVKKHLYDYNLLTANTLAKKSFWGRMADYSLLSIDSNAQELKYRFVFPEDISAMQEVQSGNSNTEQLFSYFEKEKKRVASMDQVGFYNNMIFFMLFKGRSSNMDLNYMYSINTGRLWSLGKISPDSLSFFMPISGLNWGPINGDYMYTNVSAWYLFSQKNENKNKDYWKQSPVLKDFLEKGSRKNNPVIVELKLKDNL